MTPVDMMALAAGVALSFQFRPIVGAYPYAVPPPSVMLVIVVAWFFWIANTAVSTVAAARVVRYRRGPRPAEWLAVMTTLAGVLAMGPGLPVDRAIDALPAAMAETLVAMAAWRWVMAGLMLGGIAAGFGLLRAGRSVLPPWAKAASVAALAYLTLAGPIEVVRIHGPDLLAPSGGFGPGNGWLFFWLACQWASAVPTGLMFGVPAVAALMERIARRSWRWDEWAGVTAPMMVALPLASLYRGSFSPPSFWWGVERALVAAWFLGLGLLSRFLIVKFGPAWSRWLGDQAGESGSNSSEASPANTR